MRDVLNAGIGTHRDHVPNHYVGGFHDTSPLRGQLLSPAGEFFDLNPEMGTVFRGSLAPISRMRGSGGSNAREASDAGDGHRRGDAGRAWRGARDRTIEPRPRSRPAAMREMSCRAKRTLAIPERQCALLSGDRLHSRHERNRVVGHTQYAASRYAEHHARSRRAGRHHRLYSEPQMSCPPPRSATGADAWGPAVRPAGGSALPGLAGRLFSSLPESGLLKIS